MGTLRELLLGEPHQKFRFLKTNQRDDHFYQKALALRDDLIYLRMTVDRFAKSGIKFIITPVKYEFQKPFWDTLFHKCCNSNTDQKIINRILCDYYLAENFFDYLCGNDIQTEEIYDDNVLSAIKTYFETYYDICLYDYVDCFVNCDHLKTQVEDYYSRI